MNVQTPNAQRSSRSFSRMDGPVYRNQIASAIIDALSKDTPRKQPEPEWEKSSTFLHFLHLVQSSPML
jgi:hypothetical protein